MSVTMDKSIAVPVEVVCTSGEVPFVAEGRISRFSGGTYTIDLDRDATRLEPGNAAILNFLDGATPRVIARITEVRGNNLTCTQQKVREREKRAFPRLHGGLPVRYRVIGAGPHADAMLGDWVSGDERLAEEGEWHRPDEFMNFSVTGLRFEAPDIANEGDALLLELGVRGRKERWRCGARVVRIFDIPPDERDPETGFRHRLAVRFENIPESAQQALSEMTLDIQEALL
ncbi:MAG: hypothetical protein VX265_11265 [Myxococcota bacterium]|nr:hypothetical protein [Myxococcota bacterium]MEC8423264.1 hypothetical protein [Myxococcota bacterium]